MKQRSFLLLIVILSLGSPVHAQNGPSARQVDAAIVRATRFLVSEQQPSGAWKVRTNDGPSTTSLAIMALMAAGHVPGEGPYGDAMERGIRWVLNNQEIGGRNDGLFKHREGHGPMYTHGICTLMLAEVAGMVDSTLAPRVRKALEKAVLLILKSQAVPKGQRDAGGWRYEPASRDSDLSITGWQLLALRASKNIGCDVPAQAIDYAVGYVKRCSDPRGGFAYQPSPDITPTRSGTGILCLEICGQHHAPETLGAADYLLRRPLRYEDNWFFYGVYYCSVGMFQVGGRHWQQTRDHIASILLANQRPDGSWYKSGGSESGPGANYATSMSILALAVEYQYLPIYQR